MIRRNLILKTPRASVINILARRISYTSNGNTQLHDVVASSTSVRAIDNFIHAVGKESASEMVKVVNNHGETPITTLKNSKNKDAAMYPPLFELFKHNNIKKLSEPVIIDEVLKENLHQNEEFKNILKLACEIANETREVIKESQTHPQSNTYTIQKQDELYQKIIKLRSENEDINQVSIQYFKQIALSVENYRVGNCGEFGYLSFDKALKKSDQLRPEIYRIINGDHAFLVLNRDFSSDLYDYKTWGNEAVVLDSQRGEVFPAANIEKKLVSASGFKLPDKSYVFAYTTFNPNYHKLMPEIIINFHNSKTHIENLVKLGIFSKNTAMSEYKELQKDLFDLMTLRKK